MNSLAFVTVPNLAGEVVPIYVEIARSAAERFAGLRGRRTLAPNAGMLFVHPRDEYSSYTMLGCRIPLDIIWLDGNGRVVDCWTAAPPCSSAPCPEYRSIVPARFVLELLGGVGASLGVRIGTTFNLARALS